VRALLRAGASGSIGCVEATDRPRDVVALGREHGPTSVGFATAQPRDAAAFAARIIEEEALSIFLAVDEATSEAQANARREAGTLARAASDAAAPALARLEAMASHLRALSADLQEMADQWARRRGDGV
jgi:hypothetical protein